MQSWRHSPRQSERHFPEWESKTALIATFGFFGEYQPLPGCASADDEEEAGVPSTPASYPNPSHLIAMGSHQNRRRRSDIIGASGNQVISSWLRTFVHEPVKHLVASDRRLV